MEEKSHTEVISSPLGANISSSITKKDEQDGSFLIIDNSIKASSLPDTAVQLFDVTPEVVNIQEVTSVPEISFFSEPISSIVESSEIVSEPVISSSGIAFFDEIVVEAPITSILEIKTEANNIASFIEESHEEIFQETPIVSVTEEVIESIQKNDTSTSIKKIDFNAYLTEKKAELNQFITNNMQVAESNDAEIVSYNAQIAEAKEVEKKAIDTAKKIAKQTIDAAKEAAKNTLEERIKIEEENNRIKKMIELLSVPA